MKVFNKDKNIYIDIDEHMDWEEEVHVIVRDHLLADAGEPLKTHPRIECFCCGRMNVDGKIVFDKSYAICQNYICTNKFHLSKNCPMNDLFFLYLFIHFLFILLYIYSFI